MNPVMLPFLMGDLHVFDSRKGMKPVKRGKQIQLFGVFHGLLTFVKLLQSSQNKAANVLA